MLKRRWPKTLDHYNVLPFELCQEPALRGYEATVSEFVVGLLSKKVSWKCDPWVYLIHYLQDICWKCGGSVKQVIGSYIEVYGESARTVPNMSTVLSRFGKFISNEELKALGLNAVGHFDRLKGNAPGFPYCNQCILCGAPQNNHYVMKKIESVIIPDGELGSDSPKIGFQEFVSPREGSGRWQYEK